MATIRIYKVAEVLGIPSQEVIKLLSAEHGIEAKSASSTIEEIVARQFAKRLAQERNLDLPEGKLFSQSPVSRRGGKRTSKKSEPEIPAKPKLGPPRLVKAAKTVEATDTEGINESTEKNESTEVVEKPTPDVSPTTQASSIQFASTSSEENAANSLKEKFPSLTVEPIKDKPTATGNSPLASPSLKVSEPVKPTRPTVTAPKIVTPPSPSESKVATPKAIETAKPSAPAIRTVKVSAQPSPLEPTVASPKVVETTEQSQPTITTAPKVVTPSPPPVSKVTARPTTPKPTIAASAEKASPASASPPPSAGTMTPRPTGRVVPPTLRLRVEEPKPVTQAPTVTARPNLTETTATRTRRNEVPLGGARPLPSQPARVATPASARPLPPRPAVGYRPPPRPYHRPGGRRAAYRRNAAKTRVPVAPPPPPPITRTVALAEGMTVKDLAEKLEVRGKDVLKKLIERRLMMTINTTLNAETATMIAREFGADVKMRSFEEEIVVVESAVTKPEDLVTRAPVVTVMGHVDHGKTTLLDAIREAKVAEGEAGGITQHIGAYSVSLNDRRIVFLDTPGHAAFTLMRARGAKVTDVVVLVVAADDGVMPQTQEAIDHARAAKVPIIVAINKIDKADANQDRVKQELAERDLAPEDWGGSTVTVPVSAKNRDNLDTLLEMILLVTEMGELKANPEKSATGTVLEAKVVRGRGPVATILVQDGTLNVGDNFIAGVQVGRVRTLVNDKVEKIKTIGPSNPVEVDGLTGVPQPGDAFQAVDDAAKARQVSEIRKHEAKEKALGGRGQRLTLEALQAQLSEGESKELPIIIKADVQGSSEVLADSLSKLGDERVKVLVIHTAVGAVNESDVLLASTSNAIIIAFNVRPDRNAVSVAEREGIDIRQHSVIYNVTDEIKMAMTGLLEPTVKENQLGSASIRDTFKVPKFGTAAGCMVTDGILTRSGDAKARIVRDGIVIHEGKIGSLRRFKEDANEVKSGFECGVAFERFADLKIGDVIEVFTIEKIAATV